MRFIVTQELASTGDQYIYSILFVFWSGGHAQMPRRIADEETDVAGAVAG